ncbi:hypothetical protein MHK_010795 [Candidatus Magnetomorum sp. HK-1]|nr:hypothetical protein MHK_010795 [Candidatus Magnetomorum sp. HK-1]
MSTTNKQKLLAQLIEKAFSYQIKDQHDEAIQIFQKMLNIDPDNSDAHHFLGVSYMEQKKFKKAIQELKYAIQLKPELDYYYCNLGIAYWNTKQMHEAVECLRKGMKLNNNHKFIHINLAQTLLDMGKIEESLVECRKYIENYPDDYTVFFILILIEYRLCKKNIVLAELHKSVLKKNITIDQWLEQIPESDDKYLFTKGVLFILLNKYNQGLEYLKKAEKKVPGAGWIFTYKIISQIKYHYGPMIYENKKQKKKKLCDSDYNGIITMNDLGISGRLGHQIFHYLGIKQYSRKHNLYLETSDWVGRYLFEGCDEPLISGIYDTIDSKNPMFIRSIDGNDPPQKKFNLKNGCYRHSSDEKKFVQNTLQLLPYWRKKIDPFLYHIKKDKKL